MSKARDIVKTTGTNTGDQTAITGNAGTATTLATARNINGVSFDGSANITINAVDSTARIASSLIGSASGVCPLDASSKITTTYLPSYVDDVLEYTDLASFPVTGETGKIYVDLATNKTYRWSGSAYIYITSGAVDSVAGRMGVVTLTSSDVGLSSVTNNAQVTSVSGTAPIVSSGGLSPAISISAATTSVAGSMSSADKTKLDAIAGSNTGDQIIPTTLPASDVSAWAKEATKPTYTYTEVGAQVAGNYASGTGSASGTNTGDETATTIKSALGITTLSGSNTGDQVIPGASSTTPAALGVAAVGTGTTFARADHVHLAPTTITGGAGTATSIAGQTTNGVLYQSGSGVTTSTAISSSAGQMLATVASGGAPTFITPTLINLPGAWTKKACDCATTAALTLNTAQTTIDGITLSATSRVLVKNQATASQNGIYTGVTTTTWVRDIDAATSGNIAGATVSVDAGTINFGQLWTTNFLPTSTLGTTAMSWYRILDTSRQPLYTIQSIPATTAGNASGVTLTIANMITQAIQATPTAASTYTLPTGTLIDTTIGSYVDIGMGFEWSILNQAAFVITMAVATGHTYVGTLNVAAGATTTPLIARFRTRKTAANTYVTYRIG